jgi:hypothetical protein
VAEPVSGLEFLERLRSQLLDQLAEADARFGEVRMAVERMESDLRAGLPESDDYAEAKGTELPRAEARMMEIFRELNKVEDRIASARRRAAE